MTEESKEHHKKICNEYYQKNKEAIIARRKKLYAESEEVRKAQKEYNKWYYLAHSEELRDKQKQIRKEQAELRRKYALEYYVKKKDILKQKRMETNKPLLLDEDVYKTPQPFPELPPEQPTQVEKPKKPRKKQTYYQRQKATEIAPLGYWRPPESDNPFRMSFD